MADRDHGLDILIGILCVVLAVAVVLVTGSVISDRKFNVKGPIQACIMFGNGKEAVINVSDYKRHSDGWITIRSSSGSVYKTNEKNVLIVYSGED